MSKEDFAFVGCRLIALYWAVLAIFQLSSFINSWVSWLLNDETYKSNMGDLYLFGLWHLIFYVVVALLLWFGAARFSRYLFPENSAVDEAGAITLSQVQSVLFAAVGLYLLLDSLPELLSFLYDHLEMKDLATRVEYSPSKVGRLLEILLRAAFGAALLFGSGVLSGMLTRFRELGVK